MANETKELLEMRKREKQNLENFITEKDDYLILGEARGLEITELIQTLRSVGDRTKTSVRADSLKKLQYFILKRTC